MIYLDNAATTFPKPQSVYKRVGEAVHHLGGNSGRASHSMALDAAREIFSCRKAAAQLFGGRPENTVFTYNATYALNIAIKSTYIYGSHILISDLEHNSVLRPVASATHSSFASYGVFDSHIELRDDERADAIISSIRAKMKPLTRTIICTARSNICGIGMPIRKIGEFCRKNNLFFIVDASQSAGFDDIDIERDSIDILCAPAHKGLYGIMGCGFLMLSSDAAKSGRINSFIEGGSGVNSLDLTMPDTLPERLEGGTLGTPAISSFKSGVEFIREIGLDNIREKETELITLASKLLSQDKRVRIYSPVGSSLLLFGIDGMTSEEVAARLDDNGICVRAGYHCAPLAHKRVGTPPDGAVRVSVGWFNDKNDIQSLAEVVYKIK